MRRTIDIGYLGRHTSIVEDSKSSSGIAWNYWYHCVVHTYGSWLPGDPPGFRTRHHREHVDGDYKAPLPAGKFDGLHQHANAVMKRDAVHIAENARQKILGWLVDSLIANAAEVVAASLDSYHFHILARFRNGNPNEIVGIAKKESAYFAQRDGLMVTGGVWAKRGQYKPIEDRKHQLATVRYIVDHRKHGAVIWFKGRTLGPAARE